MAAPIEFYFDFSSPFGYLASEKIDQLAAKYGREVMWRPFLLGAVFKITGGMPSRAFYWLDAKDPARARRLAQALYRAYFVDDVDISSAENTIAVAAKMGLDAAAMRAGMSDAAVKDRTRAEVEKAIAKGVFGSPYIIVDGEPFWGSDRLDQVDKWLATGGW